MRMLLLTGGLLCCFIGAEFLIVDKVLLRGGEVPADGSATQAQLVDLPDSGGYMLVAVGTICLMYCAALRRPRDRD